METMRSSRKLQKKIKEEEKDKSSSRRIKKKVDRCIEGAGFECFQQNRSFS